MKLWGINKWLILVGLSIGMVIYVAQLDRSQIIFDFFNNRKLVSRPEEPPKSAASVLMSDTNGIVVTCVTMDGKYTRPEVGIMIIGTKDEYVLLREDGVIVYNKHAIVSIKYVRRVQ